MADRWRIRISWNAMDTAIRQSWGRPCSWPLGKRSFLVSLCPFSATPQSQGLKSHFPPLLLILCCGFPFVPPALWLLSSPSRANCSWNEWNNEIQQWSRAALGTSKLNHITLSWPALGVNELALPFNCLGEIHPPGSHMTFPQSRLNWKVKQLTGDGEKLTVKMALKGSSLQKPSVLKYLERILLFDT